MFTGIVQSVGSVLSLEQASTGARLRIDPGEWDHRPCPGDSIAVSGCCLTVASADPGGSIEFDVVHQTLEKTTLGVLRRGSRVNLEHAATPRTYLGGHIVQGHIDGLARFTRILSGEDRRLTVRPLDPAHMDYIAPGGSVTVDGVSLTVQSVTHDEFTVALIPTTLERTTLGEAAEGSACNLETDVLARTVVHWLRRIRAAGPSDTPLDPSRIHPRIPPSRTI